MHTALTVHGKGIGVELNTPVRVKKDLAGVREADTAFKAVRATRLDVLTPSQKSIDAEARRFILQCKHVLKDQFGANWNLGWSQAGFSAGSHRVPTRIDEREALVERLATYLASHPELEVEKFGVTARAAFDLHERFTKIRADLKNSQAEERRLSENRKTKVEGLRKRLRGLASELGQLLSDEDERWMAFGMTPPATVKARRKAARAAKATSGESGSALQVIESVSVKTSVAA